MDQIVVLYQDDQSRLVYRYASSNYEQLRKKDSEISGKLNKSSYPVAHHVLPTPGPTLKDLQTADPYFDGVEDYTEWAPFAARVRQRLRLTSTDVAGFLQEQYQLSPLAAQRVLYYAYADSLKRGAPWFSSHFVASDQGPVDRESYDLLRDHPERAADYRLDFLTKVGMTELTAISAAAEKYGPIFAQQPAEDEDANPIHRKGTPWDLARREGQDAPITDQAIIKFHDLEAVG